MNKRVLEFTGERFVPGIVVGDIELEHLHRYALVCKLATGKRVLDIASGEGYGSSMLADYAHDVVGVDISKKAIQHAKKKYTALNLRFLEASCVDIPLPDASVDMVVSFETIEHHAEHDAMLLEIKRVLVPGGLLIISCPDKLEYSDKPGYINQFHVKELYRAEFCHLLSRYFSQHHLYGQKVSYGSVILSEANDIPQRVESYVLKDGIPSYFQGVPNAIYLIAVASDGPLPLLGCGLFDLPLTSAPIVRLAKEHAARLEGAISSLKSTIESLVVDRDHQRAELEKLRGDYTDVSQDRDDLKGTIESLVVDRDHQRAELEKLRGDYTDVSQDRDDLKSTIESLVVDRDHQRAELENLNRELPAVYQTKTWRLKLFLHRFVWRCLRLVAIFFLDRKGPYQEDLISDSSRVIACDKFHSEEQCKNKNTFRILLVSFYYPTRAHAGGLRILDLYSMIRKKCPSAQIDLLTHHRSTIDWSLDDVNILFDNVYLSPTEELSPDSLGTPFSSLSTYDVIDLQFHQSGKYVDEFRKIGRKVVFTPMESATKTLFLDLHSRLKHQKFVNLRQFARSLNTAAEEVLLTQKVDEVVCVSRSDARFLKAATSSKNISGVETGLSEFEFKDVLSADFKMLSSAARSASVIYIAYFGSETNVRALLWYLENVHPFVRGRVPEYIFTVIGRGDLSPFSKFRSDPSIEFIGEVPDLLSHLRKARVGIAPALGGSGFRGKVNQYAALGCPCVASPIALKGLSYKDGIDIFIGRTPEVFAERCVQLLTNLELNDRMGQAARKLCMERYLWPSKWDAIKKIYNLSED
ncbi:methyltransferase domain-containing protein [Polynucleobacter sp. AP-Sanab-80-C2]|uniref:methyltransferase domain-containing protein n=1 Tax=Polynucleobacter sp. AP-Sanab-80-C2 TaxID=3108274 RepID=UPI002B2254C8|nr:methyltransferase domain-containing protein [Polynucleobacter sp. AP-Sanab-80-C2]MEA9598533.1 methyltransferase domain-containing protein [Polynucleobacter sp. AP-Sanab-80-C2]